MPFDGQPDIIDYYVPCHNDWLRFAPTVPDRAIYKILNNSEGGIYTYKGTSSPFFYSRAESEKCVVVACTGLNAYTPFHFSGLKELNNKGASVIWMALPPTEYKDNLMDQFITSARGFFTSRHSPVMTEFDLSLPRHALTHSTGGQIFIHLQNEKRTSRRLSDIYTSATHIAPFFDCANASRASSILSQKAYDIYANRNLDKRSHETIMGLAYLFIKAAKEPFIINGKVVGPTYRHIGAVRDSGRRLEDTLHPDIMSAVPTSFVINKKDPFACPKTSERIANFLGFNIIDAVQGGHNPLVGDERILPAILENMGLVKPALLSDGARSALQGGTSALNAPACVI